MPSSVTLSLQRGILFLLMRMSELTLTLILKVMKFSKNNHDCEDLWRLVVLDKHQRLDNLTRTPIVLEKEIKLRWRLYQLANVVTRLASS